MMILLIGAATALVLATGAITVAADRARAKEELGRQAADAMAAQAREEAELRRQHLRAGRVAMVLRPMLAAFRIRTLPLQQLAVMYEDRADTWSARQKSLEARHGPTTLGRVLPWSFLSITWIVLTVLNFTADVYMLRAVDWSIQVAQVMALVLVTVYAVIGLLLAGFLGIHSVLPTKMEPTPLVRNMSIAALVAVGIVLAFGIASVAPYRAASVASALGDANVALAQVQAGGGSPGAVAAAQGVVESLTAKMNASASMSILLAVAGILGEIATSWAPFALATSIAAPVAGALAARSRRRATMCRDQIAVHEAQTTAEMTTVVTEAGVDPIVVDNFIANPTGGGQPPESPTVRTPGIQAAPIALPPAPPPGDAEEPYSSPGRPPAPSLAQPPEEAHLAASPHVPPSVSPPGDDTSFNEF